MLPQSSLSSTQPNLEEWRTVQHFLNQCRPNTQEALDFPNALAFCKKIRDGDILCKLLQRAFFYQSGGESAWVKLCEKYHRAWPGYHQIKNEFSDSLIEYNAEMFLTVCAKELPLKSNVPAKILFRADELRAMIDMHGVFKVLAYLSNQEFFKQAFPKATPFKIAKRSSYDPAQMNHFERNAIGSVYSDIPSFDPSDNFDPYQANRGGINQMTRRPNNSYPLNLSLGQSHNPYSYRQAMQNQTNTQNFQQQNYEFSNLSQNNENRFQNYMAMGTGHHQNNMMIQDEKENIQSSNYLSSNYGLGQIDGSEDHDEVYNTLIGSSKSFHSQATIQPAKPVSSKQKDNTFAAESKELSQYIKKTDDFKNQVPHLIKELFTLQINLTMNLERLAYTRDKLTRKNERYRFMACKDSAACLSKIEDGGDGQSQHIEKNSNNSDFGMGLLSLTEAANLINPSDKENSEPSTKELDDRLSTTNQNLPITGNPFSTLEEMLVIQKKISQDLLSYYNHLPNDSKYKSYSRTWPFYPEKEENNLTIESINEILTNNHGIIEPAKFMKSNYESLCKAYLHSSAEIQSVRDMVDNQFQSDDQFKIDCQKAMEEAGLKSVNLKEVLTLPIIHMTKLSEIFKRFAKELGKVLDSKNKLRLELKKNADSSHILSNNKKEEIATILANLPEDEILQSHKESNEMVEQQIKSISMLNNRVKRDVEDKNRSDLLGKKYDEILNFIDIKSHGLCRLDTDLQFKKADSRSGSFNGKRRHVCLYDKVILVIHRKTKRVTEKIHLQDYVLLNELETEDNKNSNLRSLSGGQNNKDAVRSTPLPVNDTSVFTFWSNPWKDKFVLKYSPERSSSNNISNKNNDTHYITFAAHNLETKRIWIDAIREFQKLISVNRSLSEIYSKKEILEQFMKNDTDDDQRKKFINELLKSKRNLVGLIPDPNSNFEGIFRINNKFLENMEKAKYRYQLTTIETPQANNFKRSNQYNFFSKIDASAFQPQFCEVTGFVLPGLYHQGFKINDMSLKTARDRNGKTLNIVISFQGIVRFQSDPDRYLKGDKHNSVIFSPSFIETGGIGDRSGMIKNNSNMVKRSNTSSTSIPMTPDRLNNHQSLFKYSNSAKGSRFSEISPNNHSTNSFQPINEGNYNPGISMVQAKRHGPGPTNSISKQNFHIDSTERLDDFDFYYPRATRSDIETYLPKSKWQNGAFIIRYSAKEPPTFCISLVYEKNGNPSDIKRDLKHILINHHLVHSNSNSNGPNSSFNSDIDPVNFDDSHRVYYINKKEETECKFTSVVSLIKYYMAHSLQPHYNELHTKLIDVFQEENSYLMAQETRSFDDFHNNSTTTCSTNISARHSQFSQASTTFENPNTCMSSDMQMANYLARQHEQYSRDSNKQNSNNHVYDKTPDSSLNLTDNHSTSFLRTQNPNSNSTRSSPNSVKARQLQSPENNLKSSPNENINKRISPRNNIGTASGDTSFNNSQNNFPNNSNCMTSDNSQSILNSNSNSTPLSEDKPDNNNNYTPDRSIWSVTRLRRQNGGIYNVTGYCVGQFEWRARNNNEYPVRINEKFAVVGEVTRDWIPVVPVENDQTWWRTFNDEPKVKRYVPEQYVRLIPRPRNFN